MIRLLAALSCAWFVAGGAVAAAEPAGSVDGAFASAVELAQKRTAKIYGGSIGRTPGYATGVIVSADGEIVTAAGALLATESLRVVLADGSQHQARVVRRSQGLQTALLKIDAPTPDYFPLADKPEVTAGDWVLAVSNAFKVADGTEPLSVNLGVLSLRTRLDARRGLQDFAYDGDVYLVDAITSNPGAAGGALIAADGALVGMLGKVIEGTATNTRLNYAVPADLLARFVAGEETASTPATSTAAAGETGIRLFALGGRKAPAYIDRVLPGSPAAAAGLRTDDLVVSLAGQVVKDGGDYRRIADSLAAGAEVAVVVKRKNELLTVRVVLAPKAD